MCDVWALELAWVKKDLRGVHFGVVRIFILLVKFGSGELVFMMILFCVPFKRGFLDSDMSVFKYHKFVGLGGKSLKIAGNGHGNK